MLCEFTYNLVKSFKITCKEIIFSKVTKDANLLKSNWFPGTGLGKYELGRSKSDAYLQICQTAKTERFSNISYPLMRTHKKHLGLWELNAKKLPPRNLFDLLKSLLRRLVRNTGFAKTFIKIAYDFGVCWRDIFYKFWKYSTNRTHLKTKEWFY